MVSQSLSEIADVIAGQSPTSDLYNSAGEGLPFYQGKTDFGAKYPTERSWCKGNGHKIAVENDILLSVRAPVGPVNICQKQSIIGRGLAAIRSKNGFSSEYIYYFLKNSETKIAKLGTGSTFKAITKADINKIKIPLPETLNDQIRIATILARAENLIAKRKESIKALDELLKSTFLEMFGDPVRNEKGWEKKKFLDVVAPDCPLTYGIVQPGEEFKDGVLIVRPVDLSSNIIHAKGLKKINPIISNKFKRTLLKGAELLMCVRGTTGIVSVAGLDLKGANVTRGITPIWFTHNFNNLFALELIKSKSIQKKIQEKTYGIALKQINLKDVRTLELISPPLSLQIKFAAIVEKVESIKSKYSKSLAELENLYGSLSQRAFKGELDVSNIPTDVQII